MSIDFDSSESRFRFYSSKKRERLRCISSYCAVSHVVTTIDLISAVFITEAQTT